MTMPFDQENPKDIVGSRKPPLHLIPLTAKIAMSMAFKNGVSKYGPFNWRSIRIKASPYVVAAQRHIDLWFDCSEEFAKDSGVHHLGHAMATLAILYDAIINEGLNDDRPIPSKASELMDNHTDQAPPEECTRVTCPTDTEELIQPDTETDAERCEAVSEGYNPIDPSTWAELKRYTNTLDVPTQLATQLASQLESGTFFVDTKQNICQVLTDSEFGNKRVIHLPGRPIYAAGVEVNRVITQKEAMLLCS